MIALALTISRDSGALDGAMTTEAVMVASEEGAESTPRDDSADQPSSTSQALAVSVGSSAGASDSDDTTTDGEGAAAVAALQPAGPLLEEEAAMTSPREAAMLRIPLTANSRPTMTTTIHAGAKPSSTSAMNADTVSSLSAIGSSSLPSVVT